MISNFLTTPDLTKFSIVPISSFWNLSVLEHSIIKESGFCGIRFAQLVSTGFNLSKNNSNGWIGYPVNQMFNSWNNFGECLAIISSDLIWSEHSTSTLSNCWSPSSIPFKDSASSSLSLVWNDFKFGQSSTRAVLRESSKWTRFRFFPLILKKLIKDSSVGPPIGNFKTRNRGSSTYCILSNCMGSRWFIFLIMSSCKLVSLEMNDNGMGQSILNVTKVSGSFVDKEANAVGMVGWLLQENWMGVISLRCFKFLWAVWCRSSITKNENHLTLKS